MSLVFSISRQHAPAKLSVTDLLSEDLSYGVIDAGNLQVGQADTETVVFHTQEIGRGVTVRFLDDAIELVLQAPSSMVDTHVAVQLIERAMTLCKADHFMFDDAQGRLEDLPQLEVCLLDLHQHLIDQTVEQMKTNALQSVALVGALSPLVLGEQEWKTLDGKLENLGPLLHQLQSNVAFVSTPIIGSQGDHKVGLVVVTSNTPTAIPLQPERALLANDDMKVDTWLVSLNTPQSEDCVALMHYETFLANVDTSHRYDGLHVVVTLTDEDVERLKAIESLSLETLFEDKPAS